MDSDIQYVQVVIEARKSKWTKKADFRSLKLEALKYYVQDEDCQKTLLYCTGKPRVLPFCLTSFFMHNVCSCTLIAKATVDKWQSHLCEALDRARKETAFVNSIFQCNMQTTLNFIVSPHDSLLCCAIAFFFKYVQ